MSLQDDGVLGPKPRLIQEEELRYWLVQETDDWLVFNKPGWVVCHPSKNGPWSSLVGAVREMTGRERLHLVSRLDRETSGVVILAKHRAAASRLQRALSAGWVRKGYVAVLEGQLEGREEVSFPLEEDSESPVAVKLRVARRGGGKKAQTTFIPILANDRFTLVRVRPHTGRKHQIRVHAQAIGHPVAGDKLYGPDPLLYLDFVENGWTKKQANLLPHFRQLLHARSMTFPEDGGDLVFEAPVTMDFVAFSESIGLGDGLKGV